MTGEGDREKVFQRYVHLLRERPEKADWWRREPGEAS